LDKPIGIDSLQALVEPYLRNDPVESNAAGRAHALRAERVLQCRYQEPDLNLQTVAKVLDISKVHLCRVFKPHCGVTFETRLRDIRLDAACQLISRGGISLKAIAYRVGFRDPSQFTRVFRARYGTSPSDYRARLDVNERQAM
jgi:AraC-like DNA-binding protein